MTPVLILVFGIHPATAVVADLLYASVTKTAGTLIHGISRTVEWSAVGRLAAGSIPATAVTLFLIAWFRVNTAAIDMLITAVLSFALCASAFVLLFRTLIEARFANALAGIGTAKAISDHLDRPCARRSGIAVIGWRRRASASLP